MISEVVSSDTAQSDGRHRYGSIRSTLIKLGIWSISQLLHKMHQAAH